MRFSRLREELGGVSQKILTKTLRQLERDGLVVRRVHAEVPPRVDYRLTPLGVTQPGPCVEIVQDRGPCGYAILTDVSNASFVEKIGLQ
jgi:DNA-binding HxlR family transcriptional regulator